MERGGETAAGPLAAAYLQVLEELMVLQADLEPDGDFHPPSDLPAPPARVPLHILEQALRQAREGLQDLHRLLST